MLKTRFYGSEIIDDFSLGGNEISIALEELDLINKFLGGYSTTKAGLKTIETNSSFKEIKILDVGSGGSELNKIKMNNIKADVTSLDRNKNICKYLREKSIGLKILAADAFYLPFKEKEFDIVHASLFLHHFKEAEIISLLKSFIRISALKVVINDLRRSAAAYLGIKILTRIFSKSPMIRNDGPLSVKRGFRKSELVSILSFLSPSDYIIKRKWAFRWLIIINSERDNGKSF